MAATFFYRKNQQQGWRSFIPAGGLLLALSLLFVWLGPIAQPPHYHQFADQRTALGLIRCADVLSNLGFALIGIMGLIAERHRDGLSRAGWQLGFFSLILTAAGSAWYHLNPDDGRLIWDRLPIALACAGFLAALASQVHGRIRSSRIAFILACWAVLSVAWWVHSGDLRPYLLLQAMPLLLLPLWQWQYSGRHRAFWLMLAASSCYILAKIAEQHDQQWFDVLQRMISGHTLKHLFASLACLLIYLARKHDSAPICI